MSSTDRTTELDREPDSERASSHAPGTRGAGRVLVVLFICAGIAFSGLLAGGEHERAVARRGHDPMRGYFPPEMPRYPDVVEVPAGSQTEMGRSRARMSFFRTKDGPDKVARYYVRFWRSRQLWVRRDVTHVGGVVAAMDPQHARMYQVLITVKDGHTLAFPSVNDNPLGANQADGREPPVPLFPESKVVYSVASEDAGVRSHVVLSLNDGGLKDNLQHYRQQLGSAGFAPERSRGKRGAMKSEEGEHRILVYRKDDQELTINLTAVGGDRVRVHMMQVGP